MTPLTVALIAASVSAAVTLLIEWAAKPQLEARKERILERDRALREIATIAQTERHRSMDVELDRQDRTSPFRDWDADLPGLPEEDSPYGQFRRLRSVVEPASHRTEEIVLSNLHDMLAADPGVIDVRSRALVLEAASRALTATHWRPLQRKRLYQEFFDAIGEAGR
ncbi:hypothetical protein [Glycomyces harbinensis]|uniref:Uncharacterized protein n=1 Tax=Glycomyces harbinensis TaxID=58114 RepID=A0A1G6SGB1_9ACTN|nr:hypothetical protein [Glycomyces harbinensis]SDD15691.1 hypothetical protein SAMN05216270_10274 [Glycomyces harbinensis]